MNLEKIYNQLEELENQLEFYENRLEKLKDDDQVIKDVEIENRQQLEVTILYIKSKIRDLETLKDKEIDRLAKYGEEVKAVVFLREKEFKTVGYGKKRHLTWDEIARKLYCSEKSARNWYKLGTEQRKKSV